MPKNQQEWCKNQLHTGEGGAASGAQALDLPDKQVLAVS